MILLNLEISGLRVQASLGNSAAVAVAVAADARAVVAVIVVVVAAVFAAAVAAVVVDAAAGEAPIVVAAAVAVQSGITVVGSWTWTFDVTDWMKPVAAGREPAASVAEDGTKVSQGLKLLAFASTTAVIKNSASLLAVHSEPTQIAEGS